ncbi:rRNA maturation RNase YbeY [bacterium]|nr:rRNA maturation RNase YbeY [bacterium]
MITVDVLESEEIGGVLPLGSERIRDFAIYILTSCGISDAEINVVFIGDEKMTELNESYRKRKGTTDVLSFNLSEKPSEKIEGEVYISLDRAKVQSEEYGVRFEEEIIRLVAHGVLHLTGRVHDTDESYRSMTGDTEKLVYDFFSSGGLPC